VRHTRQIDYAARASQLPGAPWYYLMEYLPDGPLADRIGALHQKISTDWCVELFYQLLTTIYYMHKVGYAHGDLKPENLFMRLTPNHKEVPVPVVIDFGSASSLRRGITRLAVSPRYAPPEALTALARDDIALQDLRLRADKIDVWSLGAIFFELLTGSPLINTTDITKITTTLTRGQLARIRDLRPELHESLDKLLARMLARQPSQRPNVKEVIQALEERINSVRPPRVFV
jgi:serine/threonine protein kinase